MGRIDMACLTLSPSFSFLSSFPHPLSVCSPCHQRPHHHHHLKLQLQLQLHLHQKCRRSSYIPLHCTRIASSSPIPNADGHRTGTEFVERLRTWIVLFLSFMPGGRWWRFPDHAPGEEEGAEKKMAVTVPFALHRMWQLVANDRWVIFAGFISLILAALSEISIPHFLAASIFSAQSAETLIFQRNTRILVLLCCASGICSGLRGCCFGIANMILVMRMREKLYSALLLQDISFFDTETVGDLTSRLGADCQQVSRVIGNDLNLISRNALQGTGALIYLFTLSWPLALSTVLICSALSTVMFFYGQYQKRAAKLTQEFTACANEVAQEAFSLMRTVRVYGTEKQECGRYMQWLKKLADISLRQSMAYGFWTLSFNTLYHATQVIAVLVGGIFIMGGHITVEKLTKFILYSEWLIYSTWFVGDNWSSLMQSIGASEKVFQLMDLLPSKQFLLQGLKLQTVIGHIEFVNVSFHYPSRITVPVLQHLNISLHPKEVVAIVGSNGSGKSTLVHLLLRLYEPTSGQIFIDGSPLEELDIKWLRENIGFVGQEPRLFRMDVSSNIRYGCTREISQEDVEWAAKQAYAHDFILSLPNGYETLVDNDLLSGGQKQRIAIARAILRDPAILIFDEATSALDADSEHYVKQVLHSVRHGSKEKRTVIVIAHRLSTIQAADRIVVMDSGRIVQMGDHKELLSKDGLYAQLTKRQTDGLLS
ncbi:ABC transporter B family member 26, chloroplastic isoform X1 [Magnolia sinica]|uniref:ABC transporter B family member 26, chloroplastic isoform X1 n=1 Tax=Magnolia sinica TaxID=86752 RepID=UPI00265A7689|nr:ABC transporter B family member 26, chloroplastic isoform X1 [Magnolia sinica]XP_058093740.1 ABC transporter B family member 26, chloroplastic isoform X1 [Magnolia sinica]XP_058093741.1 ABC transporter B family member 26, chloroplastic isoform X1 [Magnolia sinica]